MSSASFSVGHQTLTSRLCGRADAPWQEPPESEQIPHGTHWWDHTWGSMLNAVDNGIGNMTKALQAADMWDDTLIVSESSSLKSHSSFETPEPKLTETRADGGGRF